MQLTKNKLFLLLSLLTLSITSNSLAMRHTLFSSPNKLGLLCNLLYQGSVQQKKSATLVLQLFEKTVDQTVEFATDRDLLRENIIDSFLQAAGDGDVALIDIFLQLGIDPNTTNRIGITPLMRAAEHNHPIVIERLLEHPKIDINKKGFLVGTALKIATSKNNSKIAQMLLNAETRRS